MIPNRVVVLFIALALCACDRKGELGLRHELASNATGLQNRVDFPVIFPNYLPEGTNQEPIYDLSHGYVNMWFRPLPRDALPLDKNASVSISERANGNAECLPTPLDLPGVPTPQVIEVRGRPVAMFKGESNTEAFVAFESCSGDVKVSVDVRWAEEAPTPVILTEGMKDEAFKIFESMVD